MYVLGVRVPPARRDDNQGLQGLLKYLSGMKYKHNNDYYRYESINLEEHEIRVDKNASQQKIRAGKTRS